MTPFDLLVAAVLLIHGGAIGALAAAAVWNRRGKP